MPTHRIRPMRPPHGPIATRFIEIACSSGYSKSNIQRCLPSRDDWHCPIPDLPPLLVLIEAKVQKRSDKVSRLRNAQSNDMGHLPCNWIRRTVLVLLGMAEER